MHSSTSRNPSQAGPRRPGRSDRDDESLDEAPPLLEDEPGDFERADLVEEEDEPVEEIDGAGESTSRAFDETPPGRDEPHG